MSLAFGGLSRFLVILLLNYIQCPGLEKAELLKSASANVCGFITSLVASQGSDIVTPLIVTSRLLLTILAIPESQMAFSFS